MRRHFGTGHLVSRHGVFLLHAAGFLTLIWASWRKWPDPIVDFGRELYVPWQITQGKILYADLASLFGPLSPYVNALWMRMFGVSLITIAWCNIVIFALTLAAMYRLIRVCTDRYTAACATLMALAICGFSQYVDTSNYNFVTPYSHEATHGFALSVLTLLLVHHALMTRRTVFGAAAGLALGLSLLTKPELPVAVAAAVCVGFVAFALIDASARRFIMVTSLWLVVGSLVAPTLFFEYFRQHMDSASALKAVGAGWIAASNSAVTTNPFYVVGMGLDAPLRNALLMVGIFFAGAAFIVLFVVLSKGGKNRRSLPGVVMHTASIGLLGVAPLAQGLPIGRALPLVALAAVIMIGAALWADRRKSECVTQRVGLLMWAVFAFVLLGKIVLFARIFHYGFYLGLPGLTVAVILICWMLPEYAHLPGGRGDRDYRLMTSILLSAAAIPYLALSYQWYHTKTIPVGYGSDRFYVADIENLPEGKFVKDVLADVKLRTKPGDKVAVVPEGVMFNYLLRIESPLRVVNLMPPELLTFGEPNVVHSLEADPPALVVFVHRRAYEYGYRIFGSSAEYGGTTMAWIRERYHPVRTFGTDPTSPSGEGIEIFERASDRVTAVR
jgi:hypothetical protein